MALPNIKYTIKDGKLAVNVGNEKGSAGLIITANDSGFDKITFNSGITTDVFEIKQIGDLDRKLGINESTTDVLNKNIYNQLDDYFKQNPTSSIFVQPVANTLSTVDMVDKDGLALKNLIAKSTNLQTVGIVRVQPDSTLTVAATAKDVNSPTAPEIATAKVKALADTITNGVAKEVYDAVPKAQEAGEHFANTIDRPLQFIIGGHFYNGKPADLYNYRQKGVRFGRVSIVLTTKEKPVEKDIKYQFGSKTAVNSTHKVNFGYTIVGTVLGRVRAVEPATNIGAVSFGKVNLGNDDDSYIGLSKSIDSSFDYETIHDKGFIFIRHYNNLTGGFINSDNALGGSDSDYRSIRIQRVMDFAREIVYRTYLSDINGKLDIAPDGTIAPASVAYYVSKLEDALNQNLIEPEQATNYKVVFDPAQDVLSTDKIEIGLSIVPYGNVGVISMTMQYTKNI